MLPFYDGPRVVVVLSGEADGSTSALLRDRLVESLSHRPRSLVVDARDLTFCDLRGLDALRDAEAAAQRSGITVTVRPSPQLTWLMAAVERATRTSGPAGLDPPGCPLPG